jgi:hypothetical protein
MSKTVTIGKRPQAAAPARPSPEAVEKWMQEKGSGAGEPLGASTSMEPAAPAPKMKRLTIDIPDMLHRRVKSRCSQDGLRMAEVIRDLLEQRFPAS